MVLYMNNVLQSGIMTPILDRAPYPWAEPAALELHRTLYQMMPRSSRALVVASSVGIDTGLINPDQPPFDLWKDLLELSASSQKTRALILKLRSDSGLIAAYPLFDLLLEARAGFTDSEPSAPDGRPQFLVKDDLVTEPEALLFHDDLTLSIGRLPWLVEVLQRMVRLAPAVCRFEVVRSDFSQSGSGFRFGADILLTNCHVLLLNGCKAQAVTAMFGFEMDLGGRGLSPTTIDCDPASICVDEEDDWGIIRVRSAIPDSIPILSIYSAPDPVKDAPAFIIQHPRGGHKRLAYVRNRITYFDDRVVQYLSDTQVGSSGAPVFDEFGKVLAIHHAGGRPQEVAGQLPVKKNEGIRISRIERSLLAAGII
jgi:Trypsin-like peptidase domain